MGKKGIIIIVIALTVVLLLVIWLNYKKAADEQKRIADAKAQDAALLQQAIAYKQSKDESKVTGKDVLGSVSSVAGAIGGIFSGGLFGGGGNKTTA